MIPLVVSLPGFNYVTALIKPTSIIRAAPSRRGLQASRLSSETLDVGSSEPARRQPTCIYVQVFMGRHGHGGV